MNRKELKHTLEWICDSVHHHTQEPYTQEAHFFFAVELPDVIRTTIEDLDPWHARLRRWIASKLPPRRAPEFNEDEIPF